MTQSPNSPLQPAPRLLVGVSGSLDSTLLPGYLRAIREAMACSITALLTPTATKFINPASTALFVDRLICGDDPKDWPTDKPGRIVLDHDLLIVLPATANTLSAVANGSSLNRLTTVILAATFPVAFFPVMGGPMWEKPAVRRNVARMREDGYAVIEPVWREHFDPLMDKMHGHFSLPDPDDVVAVVRGLLAQVTTGTPRAALLR
ncbi:flavoprotein [Stappia sp. TSB10GB4]|uniref:flavoprotein n=1 Tax=Stappia sp. TSB10GB4 TaxID=2003584 RepID=UPI0016456D13|nr:flavoprotein [Stappia sp. TSB10GB4]